MAGVVVESGYTDVGALVQRRGLTLAGKPTGEDRVFDPVPKLARGTQPLLVLHGANDTLISAREAETAYAAAGGANKRLVLVPHRGHNDLSFSEVYWTALAAFASALR